MSVLPPPKQALLDPEFNGYKLSQRQSQTNSVLLPSPPLETQLWQKQYAYMYMKLHSTHNSLVTDTWNEQLAPTSCCEASHVYFVSKEFTIFTGILEDGALKGVWPVFQIPHPKSLTIESTDSSDPQQREERWLPPTLLFLNKHFACVADGAGKFYLVETGNRAGESVVEWNPETCQQMQSKPFATTLLASKAVDECTFEVALLSFHETECQTKLYSVVEWLHIVYGGSKVGSFSVERKSVYRGDSLPSVCWFQQPPPKSSTSDASSKCHLYLASTKPFQRVDTQTHAPVVPPAELQTDPHANANTGNGAQHLAKAYSWSQSGDLVDIVFDLKDVPKDKIFVDFGLRTLSVRINLDGDLKNLLCGELERSIEVEASKWFLQDNGNLEIVLVKSEDGDFWQQVVLGDSRGEHKLEGEELARIEQIAENLQHMTSESNVPQQTGRGVRTANDFNMQQLEQCDENIDDDINLYVLDSACTDSQHLTRFGNRQWLFDRRLEGDTPPCICLRHDVDGVIWCSQSTKPLQTTSKTVVPNSAPSAANFSPDEQKRPADPSIEVVGAGEEGGDSDSTTWPHIVHSNRITTRINDSSTTGSADKTTTTPSSLSNLNSQLAVQHKWCHISTLHALGYVRASKQDVKFTTCDASFSLAAITDCTSNVYMYTQRRARAKQALHENDLHIASFPDVKRILGCQVVSSGRVYVLAEQGLHQIVVPL